MNPTISPPTSSQNNASQRGEPTWEIAHLYPTQGNWTEAEYLALDTNHLIELSDGYLKLLPMPTVLHQLVVDFLHDRLKAYLQKHEGGTVLFAPLPVKLWPGKFREPDVVYLGPARTLNVRDYPEGADLVMEVVSSGEKSRQRDLVTKRQEYASAGIGEYWIVDPELLQITVLTLTAGTYRVHGEFAVGQDATSALLRGFAVSVDEVFAAAQKHAKGTDS